MPETHKVSIQHKAEQVSASLAQKTMLRLLTDTRYPSRPKIGPHIDASRNAVLHRDAKYRKEVACSDP